MQIRSCGPRNIVKTFPHIVGKNFIGTARAHARARAREQLNAVARANEFYFKLLGSAKSNEQSVAE